MGFWDMVARQYSNPRGFWGQRLGNIFARKNQPIYDWVLELLDIQEKDNILEIGYGTGNAIQQAAKKAGKGKCYGVDISELMFKRATALNKKEIDMGLMDLRHGEIEAFNNSDIIIKKAFAIHVLYFWKDPIAVLSSIINMMKNGGKIVLFVDEKEDLVSLRFPTSQIFKLYTTEEIINLMKSAGYSNIKTETRRVSRMERGVCIMGEC